MPCKSRPPSPAPLPRNAAHGRDPGRRDGGPPMTPQHRSALALPLLMSLLVGCSSQNPTNAPNQRAAAVGPDQAEVASAVASNPSYVDDEVSESPDQMTLGTTSTGALGATAAV